MIPVLNEATVLESLVRQVLTVFPNVVCVDDGSGDGSAEVVLRISAHLVRHPVNLGQGAALQTGLTYARLQPGAKYFVTYDGDGQHRLSDAEAMVGLARAGAADVVLGTRFAGGAASVPRVKRLVLLREVPVSIRYTEYSHSKGQTLLNGVNILFDLSVRHPVEMPSPLTGPSGLRTIIRSEWGACRGVVRWCSRALRRNGDRAHER